MSVTSTDTVIAPLDHSTRSLSSSFGTLSPPCQKSSHISKIYKHASASFLTKDFAEAFAALEPILSQSNPYDDVFGDDESKREAPIATASRSLRVKVWSLYLTLLNAIIDLGPEEGKAIVGSKKWREIAGKARDGSIWEDVVRIGYAGDESNVDADVVSNLATLLLSQSASQTTNQQHLETYLAASDVTRTPRPEQKSNNETNNPRDLASRIKILELYILHVLPANNEWEYAKDFIQMSDTLDDEQKEAFQQALDGLKAVKTQPHQDPTHQVNGATNTAENTSEDLKEAEPKPVEDTEHTPEHRRSNSEKDYGIEEVKKPPKPKEPNTRADPQRAGNKSNQQRNIKPNSSKVSARKSSSDRVIQRSKEFVALFQNLISNMTQSLSKNPLTLLRLILFLVALLVALSRRDVKERVKRIAGDGWNKIKRTVGMGVKVSYI